MVALQCWLPGLHGCAQLRQVAWAGPLTGAAEHKNLKRRSPDLTAFAGGGVGGFLRLELVKSIQLRDSRLCLTIFTPINSVIYVVELRDLRYHGRMNIASLFPRRIEPRIAEALLDTPVVLLAGPRQAGKTTLVRQIVEQQGLRYLTMDDELTLLSAREDPVGMIRSLDRAVIDEIQRAPQLLLAIKKSVDEDRRPGRFLLT